MKGNVTITAGQTASVRASDIIAGKDTLITGRNVDIESKDNTYRGKEEHEYKKSGLTVSLGGAAVNAARTVAAPVKRAGEVGDGRLKALYAVQAGMNARDIQKDQKTDKAINKNNAVGINISLGSTGWKDNRETATQEAKGSTITVGRTAAIIAKEDMTVKGSTVNAKDIHLKAGNNISILSSENRSTTIEDYKAKSGSIGASLSKGGYGIGASYGKGKGQIEETTLTHTPSDITAKDTATLSGGNDTLIRGGTVKGNKVIANAGGNLTIESEQDKKNYKETGKTTGLSISYTPGSAVTVSGGKGKTNTDSTYESVTKQAGLYAGQEGYDIRVKGNTHLKGAVIDSKAPAEKNRITTGTLTWENIDNKAEYKASEKGISYSTGAGVPLNALGLLSNMGPTVKDKEGTTTKSAVSKGTLTITDKENQKQDIEKLNRDTENSLNKLKEIFDKTKIEEKQELIHMMNIVGNQIIHEAADHYGWKEGSTEKLLLHGAIGALTGTMSGGNALSGAVSGSVNEFALAYMEKTKGRDWMDKHPDTVQAISTALGAVAGSLTGDRNTGAYTAQMGTRWNRLAKKPQEDLNKQLKQELSTEKKNPDELLKLLTEYINMSEAAEHPASQKALHGVWNEEKGYTLPKVTISAQEYKAIDQKSFNRVAQKYNLPTKWNNKKNVQENLESLRYDLERKTYKGRTVFQSDWAKYGGYGLDFIGELQIGNVSGLARGIGTIGDFGNYVTAEDRNKVLSEIAGGYAGSALGNKLMPIIITGMGLEQINPMGTHAVKALGISGMSLVGAFILEEAYIQKKTYLDYIYHINKYNYDQEQFDSELIQNFDIKE